MENKNQQFNNALFFAPMVLLMFFGFAVCLMMAWPADVQAADPNKTISIDFDSEEDYVESDGVKGKFSKSTLTDAQKDAVIAEVQKEYDDAVGPGKIKVKKGKDGDVKLTVNGGYAPGVNKGKELGDAGQAGQSGIAHESEFKDHGVTGDDLVKALGTALGHEAGHKLGKSHNDGNPNNKMTNGKSEPTGKGLTLDDLKAGNLMFSDTDKAQLLKNLGLTNAEHKMTILPTDLGVIVGKRIKSEEYCPIIDDYLDSYAVLTGPTGIEFGYMSFTNEFVYEGGDMLTFMVELQWGECVQGAHPLEQCRFGSV